MMADQLQGNILRPLAPRPPETETPATSLSPPEDTRARRASTACGECKQRRIKCTPGEKPGDPCVECAVNNKECIKDETKDRRRKLAAKQTERNLHRAQRDLEITQNELRRTRLFLHSILSTVRFCDIAIVNELTSSIRQGSTDEEVQHYVSQFANQFPQYSYRTPRGSDYTDGDDGSPAGHGFPGL
ncbi:Zn(II)2Cys6 transcription factor domain-containing protein [Aspergillus undulatus]|uniref:Zn(II)2Cys6 transcription factor domain-containing protein n=1 Tax=Aspergillus undulatus TaxID=1810928 RepID=UPI003CCE423B